MTGWYLERGESLVLLEFQGFFLTQASMPTHCHGNNHLRSHQPLQNQNTSLSMIANVINCYSCVLWSLSVRFVFTYFYPSACSVWLILPWVTVNFFWRKIFRGNLDEAISLSQIDVSLKGTSVWTNEITSFRFQLKST